MKNIQTQGLIQELKKQSIQNNVKIWKRIATELEKPSRKRRTVNLYNINKNAKDNDTVIIPGKVLGTGDFNKKITIVAYDISKQAIDKVKKAGSNVISIPELLNKNPKGNKVRILG